MNKLVLVFLSTGLLFTSCPLLDDGEPPASGAAQWARTVLSTEASASVFSSTATDSDGNIYASGYISEDKTYTFGTNVTAVGPFNDGANPVVVKYDSSGAAQWARTITAGNNYAHYTGTAVAGDGSVYVVGNVYGTGLFTFAPGVSVTGAYNGMNVLVVKYNNAGDAQWARTVTAGAYHSSFASVTVDGDGSVYAAGYIEDTGTYNFGNSVTVAGASTSQNPVLVKYDSNGTTQWARSVTSGDDVASFDGVAADTNGNVYAAGIISGTSLYTFRAGVAVSGTNSAGFGYNIVLVKYDAATGNALWARTVTTGPNDSLFRAVTVDGTGNVFASGAVTGTGTYTLAAGVSAAGGSSGNNALLVKYDAAGAVQWARTVGTGSGDSSFADVTADGDGNLFTAGKIAGTSLYTFGTGVTAAGVDALDNVVLVKYDSSGTAQWARTVSTAPSFSSFSDVATDADGNVFAAGIVMGMGTYTFGASITAGGILSDYAHGVLVKYSN